MPFNVIALNFFDFVFAACEIREVSKVIFKCLLVSIIQVAIKKSKIVFFLTVINRIVLFSSLYCEP